MLSAALAKSGPLDFLSEKSFLLFFAHEKGLGHIFKNSLVVLQFSLFTSPQAENDFWLDHPSEQQSKM